MSFVDVEVDIIKSKLYWKPLDIGEYNERNIVKFINEEYNGKIKNKIRLKINKEEFIELSPHKHLIKYYNNLKIDEYICVTITDIITPYDNPITKYRVQINKNYCIIITNKLSSNIKN